MTTTEIAEAFGRIKHRLILFAEGWQKHHVNRDSAGVKIIRRECEEALSDLRAIAEAWHIEDCACLPATQGAIPLRARVGPECEEMRRLILAKLEGK